MPELSQLFDTLRVSIIVFGSWHKFTYTSLKHEGEVR